MKFTLFLSLLLLNLIFRVDVNTATQDYVPINADIDHTPKNILVSSFAGGRSHLKPMLDVAAILIERGHNVILMAAGNYTPASEYPTVKQLSLGPSLELKDVAKDMKININEDKIKDTDFSRAIHEIGLKSYKDTFEKYKKAAIENNIDLFICYAVLNDPCLDVAHTLKKPVVGFLAALFAVDSKPYKSDPIYHCNVTLENESLLERIKCIVIQPLKTLNVAYPYVKKLNDVRNQIGVDPVFASMDRLAKTSLVLVDTFFGFELPQSLPPNVQEIGPVMSKEYPSLPPELSDFINSHERVLYVAFGARFITGTGNNVKLLQSFIEAISKNIIDGVVWALAQTSRDNFPSTLNLTDGSQIQTSSILNNKHPHIRIVKFAPQFAVLNHTNTKLFLSHGGAASSHESLYTGTPMLVLPFAGDQMGNSQKLKSAGVALTLDRFTMDVNDIVSKIEFLLKDEDIKKNSRRMGILAKINSKRKYRAADLIEYILNRDDLNEGSNKELNEWLPADFRMGFIRGNNYDIYGIILTIILGFVGGITWASFKLIKFIIKISSSSSKKPKKD